MPGPPAPSLLANCGWHAHVPLLRLHTPRRLHSYAGRLPGVPPITTFLLTPPANFTSVDVEPVCEIPPPTPWSQPAAA